MTSHERRERFDWSAPPGLTRSLRGRWLGTACVTFVVLAVSLFAYPAVTDALAAHTQQELRHNSLVTIGEAKAGEPVMHLRIRSIGLDARVVEGTSESALRAGIGHYIGTGTPGGPGNVGLAGHRTTYGKPFARIDELREGDAIEVVVAEGTFRYEVSRAPWVVEPNDWSPINEFPRSSTYLTLTSCHPEGSATTRIVVRARLVEEASP